MNSSATSPFPSVEEIAEAISSTEKKRSRDLGRIFGERAKTADDAGWRLLQQIFDFHFRSSNTTEPFGPMMVADGKRSMIPDDLSDEQLDELQATLEGVSDPEYQARVGDVLWLRRRDARAARIAVNAYVEAGKRVEDPQKWTPSMERYERAIRLARQIEPKGELPKSVLAHLESRVVHYNGGDPLYFSHRALKLLAEFRYGDFPKLAEIAGRIAQESRAAGDFRKARSYFDDQAMHLKLAKNLDAA
jgi:hypothetical protein